MKNKLLFDLTAAQTNNRDKYHGGSIYALTVFNKALESGICDFDCIYNPNLNISTEVIEACKLNKIKLYEVKNQEDIKKIINKNEYAKFYSAMPYNYADFYSDNTEIIITIHGLRYLEVPYDSTEIFYYKGTARKIKFLFNRIYHGKYRNKNNHKKKFNDLLKIKNKKVIAVSEHTKYALLTFYPELKNKIIVNYSPIDFNKISETKTNKDNYFLLISANRWIKNNYRAIKALDGLFSRKLMMDKRVVVCGVGNIDFTQYISNPDKFEFIDYVDHATLENLFSNAFCFIYPTLNEGFGYPPIQAMKYGTPVLASAVSSVPEVCQNSVCYFNPYSIDEIQNRVLHLCNDTTFYNELIIKGHQRINQLKIIQNSMLKQLLDIVFN